MIAMTKHASNKTLFLFAQSHIINQVRNPSIYSKFDKIFNNSKSTVGSF